jgi:hypothetical protein
MPPHRPKMAKTYNSGYSLVVTHLTTNPPVRCLNRAERTGSLVFNVLWSYVKALVVGYYHIRRRLVIKALSVAQCTMANHDTLYVNIIDCCAVIEFHSHVLNPIKHVLSYSNAKGRQRGQTLE